MSRKYKTVLDQITYSHNFDQSLEKAYAKIKEAGGKVLDVKPFAGDMHVGALITYEQGAKDAKGSGEGSKPRSPARRPKGSSKSKESAE